MSDDGVGVHAVRALREDPSFTVPTFEIGTAVLDALPVVESADTIVAVDAVHGDQPPGTIYRFEVSAPVSGGRSGSGMSLHELDLPAALWLIPPDRRPRVIVLGVEPLLIVQGLELSDTVRFTMPKLLDAIRALVVALSSRAP